MWFLFLFQGDIDRLFLGEGRVGCGLGLVFLGEILQGEKVGLYLCSVVFKWCIWLLGVFRLFRWWRGYIYNWAGITFIIFFNKI